MWRATAATNTSEHTFERWTFTPPKACTARSAHAATDTSKSCPFPPMRRSVSTPEIRYGGGWVWWVVCYVFGMGSYFIDWSHSLAYADDDLNCLWRGVAWCGVTGSFFDVFGDRIQRQTELRHRPVQSVQKPRRRLCAERLVARRSQPPTVAGARQSPPASEQRCRQCE